MRARAQSSGDRCCCASTKDRAIAGRWPAEVSGRQPAKAVPHKTQPYARVRRVTAARLIGPLLALVLQRMGVFADSPDRCPQTTKAPWRVASDTVMGRSTMRPLDTPAGRPSSTRLTDRSRAQRGDVFGHRRGDRSVCRHGRHRRCLPQQIGRVDEPNPSHPNRYLVRTLRAPVMQRRLLQNASGSVRKHSPVAKVAATARLVPDLATQRSIERQLDLAEAAALSAHARLSALRERSRLENSSRSRSTT